MISDFDILAELSKVSLENYTSKDRYHDFRRVFMGSDEGKRVLAEIVAWGKLLDSPRLASPIDPLILPIRYGEQNIVRRLLVTLYKEPPEKPTQTKRSPHAT